MGEFITFLGNNLADFWTYTGFANATVGHVVMLLVGLFFIYLAVAKEFEPMLLIPIGFGMLIGNIPFNMEAGLKVGIYEEGSVLNILYQGVTSGWYPPLIFLGIGAMTDFSALISNPKLMLVGAAAQFGIFGAYMIALAIGFDPMQAGAIGIIGGADGPTAIFLSSKLAPNLMGAIAVSAYSYMALVPVIQPPIMRWLTSKNERLIRMKPPLRKGSETYGKWYGLELSEENKKQFYIPKGFAHGYLVLSEWAEFCYKCTDFYHPGDDGGLVWNDPAIGITWPDVTGEYPGNGSSSGYHMSDGTPLNILERDENWPTLANL